MEKTKQQVKSIVDMTLDRMQKELNASILKIELDLLYSNKIYDEEALELHDLFNSVSEKIMSVIDHQKSEMTSSFENLFEESIEKVNGFKQSYFRKITL